MKILPVVVLLTIVAGVAPRVASQSGDETKLLALENSWNQAQERRDVRAVAGLVDDTLIEINDSGHVENKAQYLARVAGASSHDEKEEHDVNELQTARIYGNCGVVTGIYRTQGVKKGKPYLRRSRFSDTWVYKDGKWVVVVSQLTPIPQ
jgi:hypothetical protein